MPVSNDLIAAAIAAYPYQPTTVGRATIAPGQPLTLRQAYRLIAQHKPMPASNLGQRRAVLAAIAAVQQKVAITYDCALDIAEGQLPLGYNIPAGAAFAWQQLLIAVF